MNTKFNVGDLIAPLLDYNDILDKRIIFTPFTPNEKSICTVKSIDMNDTLYVEEVNITPDTYAFNAKCWRLVESVKNLMNSEQVNELIEESTMVLI